MKSRIVHQLVLLILLSLLLGAAANKVSPRGIMWYEAWSQRIEVQVLEFGLIPVSLAEAERILSTGEYLIFDARSHPTFVKGHLPGAISVPYNDINIAFEQVQVLVSPDQPILVYCSGISCDDSIGLGRFLKEQGVNTVAVFLEGYKQWQASGKQVEIGE